MAYTSLYRKYRPSTFDEMVGQQHIRQTLKNSIKSASIAHAYLFTGTRGTGKTSTAKIFAKAVNCLHPKEDGSPCNECEVCKALSSPNNLDIIELDAASNNSVEDIRDLVEKVKYAPSVGKYKVYIVDEVHMLTKQAFNAFLKTLEEPPEHVIFILATTEVQTIPATILSRCIRFDFRLIPKEELASHLEKIFVKESVLFDKEAALAIAEAGNGSVRDALSIADMVISYCGNKKIEYSDVLEILGASSPDNIIALCENILQGNLEEALSIANKLINMGKSVQVLSEDIAKMMNNIMFAKNTMDAVKVLGLPIDLFNKVNDASVGVSNYKLYRACEIFTEVQNTLKYSTLSRVVIEVAIAKACDVSSSIDTSSVLARIKDLEGFKRSIQGVSTTEGTTLTAVGVFGRLLNMLNESKRYIPEYSTLTSAGLSKENIVLDNKVFIITVFNEDIAKSLMVYKDTYLKMIKSEFSEIKDIEIRYIKSPVDIRKGQVNELFNKTLN